MLFLGPLYRIVEARLAAHINHFPLIRLVFYSLDKTLLYLLIFLALRLFWQLLHHRRLQFGREVKIAIFAGYLILLLMLTVFRDVYYPWQLHFYFDRPLSVINFKPLVETLKLHQGVSKFDFWYQSVGNVAWFLPLGFGAAAVSAKKQNTLKILFKGALFSLLIETLQFLLISGVADIDDVIFNSIGAVLGYWLYKLWH